MHEIIPNGSRHKKIHLDYIAVIQYCVKEKKIILTTNSKKASLEANNLEFPFNENINEEQTAFLSDKMTLYVLPCSQKKDESNLQPVFFI